MRIAYLDCFAGISGDMFLGALLDAGVPLAILTSAVEALKLDASLQVHTVDRSGIAASKVTVLESGLPAEGSVPQSHAHDSTERTHAHSLGAQGHAHHAHGRSLPVIRDLIQDAPLDSKVKSHAIRTFELLGQAEARVHNVPVEQIQFHEVGAVDAIVDIVCASAGIVHLGVGAWYCSPVNVGGGMVVCAHGTFPVPAPATADLLRGVPTYSAHVQKELVTPTGAAILRTLSPAFGPQPAMSATSIGYGAGSRNPEAFPNVLRLTLGETSDLVPASFLSPSSSAQMVAVLETALDDATPQLLGYVTEVLLTAGALDVMLTPVIMKKGRPGSLLTVLCDPAESSRFERILLRETTTLGVRTRQDRRACLDRTHTTVQTLYGEIRVKVGSLAGEVLSATPEFEDCRAAATSHEVPLKHVTQAAMTAYLASRS